MLNLNEFLLGVLAAALRRDVGDRALQNLQQRLLHALAGYVACDGGVFALAGNLVDLVDIDDAALGLLDIVVGGLNQTQQDVFHVLAHIARLGQGGGVRNGKGYVQHFGQRLGQIGLVPRPRAPTAAHCSSAALHRCCSPWRGCAYSGCKPTTASTIFASSWPMTYWSSPCLDLLRGQDLDIVLRRRRRGLCPGPGDALRCMLRRLGPHPLFCKKGCRTARCTRCRY